MVPRSSVSETSSSARTDPNVLDTPVASSAGGTVSGDGLDGVRHRRRSLRHPQLGRLPGQRAIARAGRDHDRQRQHVGRGVEQVVARVTPTDCSAGPSAPAPPNSSDAARQRTGSSARRSPAPPPSGPGRSTGLRSSSPGRTATGTSRRRRRGSRPPSSRAGARARRRSPSRARRRRSHRPCGRPGPSACRRSTQRSATVASEADQEQRVDLQRRRAPAARLHQPSANAGRCGACGWISGLPRKNASPMPNSISAMPTATSLTRGRRTDQRVQRAQQRRRPRRRPARRATASRSGTRRRSRHRAHHQRSFQAQVDAPALLGQALAQADEQERRADRGSRRRTTPAGTTPPVRVLTRPPLAARTSGAGRRACRWRRITTKSDPLQHRHRRVGQPEHALQQAAAGADAAEQDRHRDDAERVVRGR